MIKDGTVEFTLSRGLDYKLNGGTETAHSVVLHEPGMEHIKFYLRLKQMLTSAQMEMAAKAGAIKEMQESIGEVVKSLPEEAERLEKESDDQSEFYALALEASTVDIGRFIGTFEKMVCLHGAKKPIVMVDGKTAMTGPIWNNLKPDDAFNMAVRWCVFFGTPSQEGTRTTSDRPSESHTEPTEA